MQSAYTEAFVQTQDGWRPCVPRVHQMVTHGAATYPWHIGSGLLLEAQKDHFLDVMGFLWLDMRRQIAHVRRASVQTGCMQFFPKNQDENSLSDIPIVFAYPVLHLRVFLRIGYPIFLAHSFFFWEEPMNTLFIQ
jgi:hypothetical protein